MSLGVGRRLTLISYALVRGGLIAIKRGTGKEINVYVMAGVAGAIGFLAEDVYDKLRTVIGSILRMMRQ